MPSLLLGWPRAMNLQTTCFGSLFWNGEGKRYIYIFFAQELTLVFCYECSCLVLQERQMRSHNGASCVSGLTLLLPAPLPEDPFTSRPYKGLIWIYIKILAKPPSPRISLFPLSNITWTQNILSCSLHLPKLQYDCSTYRMAERSRLFVSIFRTLFNPYNFTNSAWEARNPVGGVCFWPRYQSALTALTSVNRLVKDTKCQRFGRPRARIAVFWTMNSTGQIQHIHT